MWDRLLVDCNIATMDPAVAGAVRGDREWRDRHPGRADRPRRPADRAGRLPGEEGRDRCAAPGSRRGWSIATPISSSPATAPASSSSGSTARPMRRSPAPAAASPSTVKATRAATLDELVEASRPRLKALMAGGVTTVEIKSGYGLDIETELKMLRAAEALGESETVRVERTLAGAARLAARIPRAARGVCRAGDREHAARGRRSGAGDRGRRLLRGDRLHPRRGPRPVRGGGATTASGSSSTPSSSAICAAPSSRRIMARSPPTISNMSTRTASRRWRGPGWSRCCCPAPSMRSRRRGSRRSTCCAATACRWRWRPTAIPAPRRSCRRP